MIEQLLPPDVMRFVLTSVPSVPYLEAMLLLRQEAETAWSAKELARRLYIQEKKAEALLSELMESGILVQRERSAPAFHFSPVSDELRHLIDRLAVIYTKNIIEVSNLIHSKNKNNIQQFADAFRLRKDT